VLTIGLDTIVAFRAVKLCAIIAFRSAKVCVSHRAQGANATRIGSPVLNTGLVLLVLLGLRLDPLVAAEPKALLDKPAVVSPPAENQSSPSANDVRIAFVGLHGGVFEVLQSFGAQLGLQMDYLTDDQIRQESVDFARYQVVLLQHVRGEDRDHYQRLIASAKQRRPVLRVLSISGVAERSLPEARKQHWIE
jgi:hypothetical protein